MFNQKDQLKFEIISKLVAGLIDSKLASKALNVSYRTIYAIKNHSYPKEVVFLYMVIKDIVLIMLLIVKLKKK